MSNLSRLAFGALTAGIISAPLTGQDFPSEHIEFFEKEVRPVLAKNCLSCHGSTNDMAGLRLDSRQAALDGGHRGPAIVPGDAAGSRLIQAVRHENLEMPMGGKLAEEEIAALVRWIDAGAAWPNKDREGAREDEDFYARILREHWAFQAVAKVETPASDWSQHAVDRFITAKLAAGTGETPSGPADQATLIRRASLVVTGLPPTPEETGLFLADESSDAYEKLVDRLLDSPRFGEHWARHWMDVVRFGETLGNDWNYENNGAWHYRDYLIRAFNNDVPYDQLVREHIAGDLLEHPRINEGEQLNESIIGTFFYRLGEQGHDDCTLFREVRTDVVDNQIDTLGKAFQGLTIACARCHDHKLDPIPTTDYYALYGVLDSTRLVTRTIDLEDTNTDLKRQLRDSKADIQTALLDYWKGEFDQLGGYLLGSAAPDQEVFTEGGPDPERVERVREVLAKQSARYEDPLFPWAQVSAHDGDPAAFAKAWERLQARYKKERHIRASFNEEHFETLVDFRNGGFGGWYPEGHAFDQGAVRAGEFAIAPEGDEVLTGVYPAGIYSHLLSERLNGVLRSPYLPRDRNFVSIQMMGGKLGGWRSVLDNCLLSENYAVIDEPRLKWIKIPARSDWDEYRFYVELVTKDDNPRIPDRPGRLKATPEQIASKRSYFGVGRAVLHDCDEQPEDELHHMARLLDGPPPASLDELAARYTEIARKVIAAWEAGNPTDDDIRWLDWLLSNRLLANSKYITVGLKARVERYRAIERRLVQPRVIQGVADLEEGFDVPLLKAGNAKDLGDLVPRGFLTLLKDGTEPRPHGSGRLQVAEELLAPDNPLTARVMANRVWHHLFGRGIVPTTDNFGRFGEMPSHPDLLDHLSTYFVEQGWSVKKLIRHVVLSETFRQSSDQRAEFAESDPENRLYHRYPMRRLGAEAIRDSVLATSGHLNTQMYGPSIHPYREQPKEYRKLYSGPVDGNGRRGIYLKVTRHEGDRLLELFDFPTPLMARGKRDDTNVPGQALALMNHPFVLSQAKYWAAGLLKERVDSVEARLGRMFRRALGRSPSEDEIERFRGLAAQLAELHGVEEADLMASQAVWQDVAHSIFNLKEFIYIR